MFLIESTSCQSYGRLIMTKRFDFSAFKRAVEQRDVLTCAAIFADDAESIEYKPNLPNAFVVPDDRQGADS